MSSSPGFLEFFILEASEYVEELDGLLLGGGGAGPNAESLQRVARALRGTATMAKIPAFADLAAGVERVGRALVDGSLQWEPGLSGAVVAAIDDFKTLLHSARTWSPADARRAAERAAELARFAPIGRAMPTPAHSRGHTFLATEAANIAAGLELLTTRPRDAETAANVLRRVRALRGVAAVKEVGPLADVLEATEEATRGLELEGESLSPDAITLLTAAAVLLRKVAAVMREVGDGNAPTAERDRFTAAYDTWSERQIQRERVVPIADLFYADGAPGVVDEAKTPPTSRSDRFRLELVSQAEHLRSVVSGARAGTDPASAARARRALRRALRSIQATAESFGQGDIAALVAKHSAAADRLDAADLGSLENLAHRLSEPGAKAERVVTSAPPAPAAPRPVAAPTPPISRAAQVPLTPPSTMAPQAPMTPAMSSRTPAASLDALNASIAALDDLAERPFSIPTPAGADDDIVPIEALIYRGRSALNRAREIRDRLRREGQTSDPEALDELFDLLELAQAE